MNERRAHHPNESTGPRVERRGLQWRLRSLPVARQLLRARGSTTQAGFTAEFIPQGVLKHHPILISDGPIHDEQRRKVARFFAPSVVRRRHLPNIERVAQRRLAQAISAGVVDLDEIALHYTVEVTAQIVGLTESKVESMSRRLELFFNQPPFDLTQPHLGRTRRQWALAAVHGLVPIVRFYLADVRPAIRSRRREPQDDVISHLIAEGYTDADILVECMTYGTAGMVTTREFICMAALHLLRSATLREQYLSADTAQRYAILAEIIRLEPVVGHLYRRITQPVSFEEDGCEYQAKPGDLIDIYVRDTNIDEHVVGEHPLRLCPERHVAAGVDAAGLSFGDGAHKCPGQALAIAETDEFLRRLLAQQPEVLNHGKLDWDDLIAGYQLRGVRLRFPTPSKKPPEDCTAELDRSSVASGFDKAARRYRLMTSLNPGYRRHLRTAAETLIDTVDSRTPVLLDLGCGTGLSTEALLEAAQARGIEPEIIGVDASAGMLQQARHRHWPPNVRFVHARAEQVPELGLPLADGAFACYLLRNVPDLDGALDSMSSALQPGAPLLVLDYSIADSGKARRRWRRIHRWIISPLAAVASGNPELYNYLHRSVEQFEGVRGLIARLRRHGFTEIHHCTVKGWQRDILHLLWGRRAK